MEEPRWYTVMQKVCDHEGCDRGIDTGYALHRTSPKGKGQPFVGLCSEHYTGKPNPVAQVIEDANHARTEHTNGTHNRTSHR